MSEQQPNPTDAGTAEDNSFTLYGYHVVCLIDVLGQKQKLSKWARLPEDGAVTSEFREALTQTTGVVMAFRDAFLQFFQSVAQCTMPDKLAALPKRQQDQYRRFQNCDVHVERFSDTFVFSSRIPNEHGDTSITPVYRILGACCYAMVSSLAVAAPARGAITIGAGAVLKDDSFYGPALAEAHRLESEVAGHPRVIVSDTVRQFLAHGQSYSEDAEMAVLMKHVAGLGRQLVYQDVDGYWAVDFLGRGIREVYGNDTPLIDAVQKAYGFVRGEAKKFRDAGDEKLTKRYGLVQQYVESRLPLWGIQADG